MSQSIIESIESAHLKTGMPNLSVGDTVDVHVRILEGTKERIQIYNGVIIKRQGRGLTETITVRRIVANEGVERVFPLHSPMISKIEIVRHGHVRRARLYYLRDRVGKKRRLRDRRRGLGHLAAAASKPKREKVEIAEPETVVQEAEPVVAAGKG